MIIVTKDQLDKAIDERLGKVLKSMITELDATKHYILIIPESVSLSDVREALEPLRGVANLVALQADGIKLLELS